MVRRGLHAGLTLRGGLFAHGIDGAARLAIGLRQPRGAAHHFHVVINGHVGHALRVTVGVAGVACRHGGGHAVFFNLVDVEAPRLVAHTVAVADDVDARGGLERLVHGVDAALLELLLRHHRDGLRRLPHRQFHARGGLHGRSLDFHGRQAVGGGAVVLLLRFLGKGGHGEQEGGRKGHGCEAVEHEDVFQ